MKKKDLRIKKKQQYLPFYIGFCVIMFGLGLFCLFLPYITPYRDTFSATRKAIYLALGGLGTVYFAFLTSYLVFQLVSPPTALLISSKGLTDFTTAGKGAGFIPKDSIISLKVFGIKKKLYLGIKVSDESVSNLGLKPAAKREIQSNISSGMPAIIIKQSDVNVPIRKLLKLIVDRLASENSAPSETQVPLTEASTKASIAENEKTSQRSNKARTEDEHISKQIFGTEPKIADIGTEDKKSKITVMTTEDKKVSKAEEDVKIFSFENIVNNTESNDKKTSATVKSVDELLDQLLNAAALEKPSNVSVGNVNNPPIRITATVETAQEPNESEKSASNDPIESEYFVRLFSSDNDKR